MCGMQCQWRRSSHRKPTIPGHFRNICNHDIEWLEPASAPLKCCGATGLGFSFGEQLGYVAFLYDLGHEHYVSFHPFFYRRTSLYLNIISYTAFP